MPLESVHLTDLHVLPAQVAEIVGHELLEGIGVGLMPVQQLVVLLGPEVAEHGSVPQLIEVAVTILRNPCTFSLRRGSEQQPELLTHVR